MGVESSANIVRIETEFTPFPKISRLFRPVVITEKIDGCLPFWTRISMANGDRVPISQVRPGDKVLGYQDGEVISTTVMQKFDHGAAARWMKVKGTRNKAGRGSAYAALNPTPNHQIWVPGSGYVRAEDLRSGDPFLVLRSEMGLTPIQHSVLLGKLLGDGYLDRATSGSASIAFGHRVADAEYIDWTLRALGDLASSTIEKAVSGYGSQMVRSRSVFAPTIAAEFGDFISSAGRHIPSWVAEDLDPLSLAFWYMDDGSLGDDGRQECRANIATHGFTAADHNILRSALGHLGIRADIQETKGMLALRFAAEEAERLFLLVAPYIPPCMQRKLPERYRGGSGWLPDGGRVAYKTQLVEQEITELDMDAQLNVASRRHDIATGTHNFFANGILVHNSNAAVVVSPVTPYNYGDDEVVGPGIVINTNGGRMDGWQPLYVYAQSRKQIISPEQDNFGFAAWVREHARELAVGLGEGVHFGEWWGSGIQRKYGLNEKRFSLFNVKKWGGNDFNADGTRRPDCCHVVPVLAELDQLDTAVIKGALLALESRGSLAAPGFMDPEGIVTYHAASNRLFKTTIKNDSKGKEHGA